MSCLSLQRQLILAALLLPTLLSQAAWAAQPQAASSAAPVKSADVTTLAPFTLADLEQLALHGNPTLAQAAAAVDAARGRALQAGLPPNPTVGFRADNIGIAGSAGEFQGGFVEQTIVTAGKLRLSRAKYHQEACEAEIRIQVQQYRVLSGVRLHFYELLANQKTIELHRGFLANAEESLRMVKEMANTGQANRVDVLQAQVALNEARIALRFQENRFPALWQNLAALVGKPDIERGTLQGALESESPPLDRDISLNHLLSDSPEVEAARAHVVRDQIALQREKVEPIPDIQLQAAAGYSFETRNAVAGAQVGVALPLWNRNQGTIQEAQADLARSQAEVTRIELSLRQRFAEEFDRYETALETAQIFRDDIIPQSREAYEIQQEMYKKRRSPWRDVVESQRKLLEAQARYTQSMLELRRAEVAIRGLLLMGGLSEPPAAIPASHLDVTPNPR